MKFIHSKLDNPSLDILYEDDSIIVLDKLPGVVIHPSSNYRQADTLVHALKQKFSTDKLSTIAGRYRPGIVHRLDQYTSGLMVVTKSNSAHLHLSQQIALKQFERIYIAFIWGVPNQKYGTIRTNVQQRQDHRAKMAIVSSGGKIAVTHYKVLASTINNCFSVIYCKLATGKTHQIRLHMQYIGHPIVGDKKYGINMDKTKQLCLLRHDNTLCVLQQHLVNFTRQALHSHHIAFTHPATYDKFAYMSTLPSDMQALLQHSRLTLSFNSLNF